MKVIILCALKAYESHTLIGLSLSGCLYRKYSKPATDTPQNNASVNEV